MAITISKQPSGIYPGYNDSYLEFSSDLANNNKAEISLLPASLFPNPFVIYPDLDGNYLFNLKEVIKVIFNQNQFEDTNLDLSVWWKSITGLYLEKQIDIEVFNDSTSETTSATYEFQKGVKQVGQDIFDNEYQLLTHSINGIDHELTYFEGFPFSVDILKATLGADLKIVSLNTTDETTVFNPTATDSFRINIDRGDGDNFTTSNILPLITGQNKLEIYENDVFKTNLYLTKKENCEGIYLKWFNSQGGFSHYLFDRFFINQIQGRTLEKVLNYDFANIEDSTGFLNSTGKQAAETINVKARYEANEHEVLKDIFKSPYVQMYTSMFANIEGRFIDVDVEGSMSFSNKRGNNEIALIIQLPEVVTPKL